MDIAIIGMSCRFPGAENSDDFWRLLLQGDCAITDIPDARWRSADLYDYGKPGHNKQRHPAGGDSGTDTENAISQRGGFITDVDKFDANFFNISALEAESLDPQQRLALELAWHCIEDSGYQPEALRGEAIGTFLASASYDYKEICDRHNHRATGHEATGIINSVAANRLSYFFDWHGPSMVVDTACSSSLVAIDSAIKAMASGDCESALVGAVHLLLTPAQFVRFSKMGMLSPTGQLRAFDEKANGYVRGEGAGFLYLKPLLKARQQDDRILAVIKASAVNHGGKVRSLTSPSAIAQSKVITSALHKAKVPPSSIRYIEAHGTGTPMGDPIEFNGLLRAFRRSADANCETHSCAIGTVKSAIGHLEIAAGMAGLIKVILAFKHEVLPANVNLDKVNARLAVEGSPFYFLHKAQPWPSLVKNDKRAMPRRAGISSFGFGGTNAHVIVEEPPVPTVYKPVPQKTCVDNTYQLLVLSAKSKTALHQLVKHYVALLHCDTVDLATLCATVSQSRSHFHWRLALVVDSVAAALAQLKQFLINPSASDWVANTARCDLDNKNIAFLYTGQGAQYCQMGRQLFLSQAVYREAFIACDQHLSLHLGQSIVALLYGDSEQAITQEALNNTRYAQPALFAFEYALSQFWLSLGVKPKALMGHSLGEIVAACIAGVFSLADAARLVVKRGALMARLDTDGAMAAIMASLEQVSSLVSEFNQRLAADADHLRLDIAAINAANAIVISGPRRSVTAVVDSVKAMGIDSAFLAVSQAFHSQLLDPVLTEFDASIQDISFNKASIALVSNLSGDFAKEDICQPGYWVEHIRKPVLFYQGVKTLEGAEIDTFLEVGPKPHLSVLANMTAVDSMHIIASNDGVEKDDGQILRKVAQLYLRGIAIDFSGLYAAVPVDRSVRLPLYPFDRHAYWVPGIKSQYGGTVLSATPSASAQRPWLGAARHIPLEDKPIISFETQLPQAMGDFLAHHQLYGEAVIPAAVYISLVIAAANDAGLCDDNALIVEQIEFLKLLKFRHDEAICLHIVLRCSAPACWEFSILRRTEKQKNAGINAQYAADLCVKGRLLSAQDGDANAPVAHRQDVDSQQQADCLAVNPATLYQSCHAIGLQYGSAFQAIKTIHRSDDTAQSVLYLPKGVLPVPEDVQSLHPVLLDAAFQTLAALIFMGRLPEHSVPLPATLEKITLSPKANLGSPLTARARVLAQTAECVRATISLCDSDNTLVAKVEGLQLNWVRDTVLLQQLDEGLQASVFYSPRWQVVDQDTLASGDQRSPVDGPTCIIYSSTAVKCKEALCRYLLAEHGLSEDKLCSIHIAPSPCAQPAFEYAPGHWCWASNDRRALLEIVTTLPTLQKLIYLIDDDAGDAVLPSVSHPLIFSVYESLQAFIACGYQQRPLSIAVMTTATVCQQHWLVAAATTAAIVGLLRSLAHEYSAWSIKQLAICRQQIEELHHYLPSVFHCIECNESDNILLSDGVFYAQHYVPVVLPERYDLPYVSGGVYVIFGGAGGIGWSLANYLLKTFHAHIALVGRSPASDALIKKITALNAGSGQINYYQADLTVLSEVSTTLKVIANAMGDINGIVHSAAVVSDSAFATMTTEQFAKVLAPKVAGSINLSLATAELALDFMVFFSSAAVQFASAGQSNYVAANACMDTIALQLNQARAYPVKVINWGFWGEAGLAASDFYHKAFAWAGIGPLGTEEGIEAVHRVLASSPMTQCVVVKAEDKILRENGFMLNQLWYEDNGRLLADSRRRYTRKPFTLVSPSVSEHTTDLSTVDKIIAADTDAMTDILLLDLARLLSDILHIDVIADAGGIDQFKKVRMTRLGIDSLTTTELKKKVRDWLGIDIPSDTIIGGGSVIELVDVIRNKLLLRRLSHNLSSRQLEDEDVEVFVL
ncbi:MAG: SDR family NAD(P)-dependent oxidoreductase [Cellvibrionaceae bacterium]|nr:SDR family NAD(P)-dependent oxidoreductase [Cellvibrionaceae bacterium]